MFNNDAILEGQEGKVERAEEQSRIMSKRKQSTPRQTLQSGESSSSSGRPGEATSAPDDHNGKSRCRVSVISLKMVTYDAGFMTQI